MSRNVEHMTATHRNAQSNISRQPVWALRIDVKKILREDPANTSNEHIADKALRIAQLIRANVPPKWLDFRSMEYDDRLDEILDGLEVIEAASDSRENVDRLDGCLEELYDWGNSERVWLGD